MARFIGNATGRTLAETIEKASGHLSDKDMPKAMESTRAKRFSPRPAPRSEPEPVTRKVDPVTGDTQD